MSFFGLSKNKSTLSWNSISDENQLNELEAESHEIPVLILKHSTRCSISAMAKNRIELYWDNEVKLKPVYLDLLTYRSVSDAIATRYAIKHESPQVIILKNGKPVFVASHNDIDYNTIKSIL